MIYIKKSEKYYWHVIKANNGEILATSETFPQKHSCWKNIKAIATVFQAGDYFVVDESLKKPKTFYIPPEKTGKGKKVSKS